MLIAQRNIDIGMFYIILCEQMKYFGIDNKILTPHTTPQSKLYAHYDTQARTDQESICGNGASDRRE